MWNIFASLFQAPKPAKRQAKSNKKATMKPAPICRPQPTMGRDHYHVGSRIIANNGANILSHSKLRLQER